VVLTGVHFDEDALGAAAFDRRSGAVTFCFAPRVPGHYHGTGDLFAAAVLAGLMAEKTLGESTQIAADFTSRSIELSDREERYGVRFEAALPGLMKDLNVM
jgi:pyridoxine kinase